MSTVGAAMSGGWQTETAAAAADGELASYV